MDPGLYVPVFTPLISVKCCGVEVACGPGNSTVPGSSERRAVQMRIFFLVIFFVFIWLSKTWLLITGLQCVLEGLVKVSLC